MNRISIRKATIDDILEAEHIYAVARAYMRQCGNRSQWQNGYPGTQDILNDIQNGNLYIGTDKHGDAAFVFAFIIGKDPTYGLIDGEWINDEEYGTLHRIASSGKMKNVLESCVNYCKGMIGNIRIDTHKDNFPMLKAIEKCGFVRCGVITAADGGPREAFQLRF